MKFYPEEKNLSSSDDEKRKNLERNYKKVYSLLTFLILTKIIKVCVSKVSKSVYRKVVRS